MRRTVCDQRLADHVLHHDVGLAVLGCSAVEQARYVRMIERRQDLAFVAKAALRSRIARVKMQNLERYAFGELLVVAIREKHGSHSAAPKQFLDAIRAYPAADPVAKLRSADSIDRNARPFGKLGGPGLRFVGRTRFR